MASSHSPNSPQKKKQNTRKKYCVSAPARVAAASAANTHRGRRPACRVWNRQRWAQASSTASSMSRAYMRVKTAMPWEPTLSRNTAAATQAVQNRPVSRRAAAKSAAPAASRQR